MRSLALSALLFTLHAWSQPYSGTIFVDPDIISDTDPSAFVSSTYTGQSMETVYDYRIPGWVDMLAYHFTVHWDDGLSTMAMVDPEFGSEAAAGAEAVIYGTALGKVPACLREGVYALWIHAGVASFGGGSNAITIHTGRGQEYIDDGILEEAFVHESTHCSLSPTYDTDASWLAAQAADPDFISTYAQDYPLTEDLPETYLMWLAVRHRPSRISVSDYNTTLATIPNRLAFLDGVACELYPLIPETGIAGIAERPVAITVFPSPAHGSITVASAHALPANTRFTVYAADGRPVRDHALNGTRSIGIDDLAPGAYHWRASATGPVLASGTLLVE